MIVIKNKKTKYHKFICQFAYNPEYIQILRDIRQNHLKDWRDLTFDGELKAWCFSKHYVYELLTSRMEIDEEASQTEEIKALAVEEKKEEERVEKLKNVSENQLCEVEVSTKLPLFPFQKKAVDFIDKVGGKAILALDMGMGKTACAIGYAVYKQLPRILVIAPASIKDNWKQEIERFAGVKANIIEREDRGGWEIIGYPNLEKFKKYLYKQQYDLIVVDECFPYNTRVFTDKGYKKIGDIVENNLDVSVLSCNFLNNELEYKKVIGGKKTQEKKLLKVNHEKGSFYCTPEHKIFTENGYRKAETLQCGEKLRILREKVFNSEKRERNSKVLLKKLFCQTQSFTTRSNRKIKKKKSQKRKCCLPELRKNIRKITKRGEEVLFNKVFSYIQVFKKRMEKKSFFKNERKAKLLEREKKTRHFRKNEEISSNEIKKNKREIKSNLKKNRAQTSSAGRKWKEAAKTSKKIIRCIIKKIKWVASRICCKNWEESSGRIPSLLQGGHSTRGVKHCCRSGRRVSQFIGKTKAGQKKGFTFETARVESIENSQRGSFKKHRRSGEKSLYDIEVEDNHNYFADDVLVSNCHLIKNRQSKRTKNTLHLLKKTKDAVFLSGTPILNRPVEIYNVFNYIKPTPFWGQDGFALTYCGAKETRFGWDLNGASNLDKLRQELTFMLRWRKEDFLKELPDKTHNTLYTEMVNWDNYYDILNDYRSWLKNNDLNQAAIYAEALTKINYLKQEVAFQKVKQIHKTIEEFLEAGKNVIVFSQYKTLINKIRESYIQMSTTLTGDTPDKERQLVVDNFQKDPNCRIFFSTIKAGGVGITLTKADTVLFTDLDWTPAMHQQAEDRAWRHGQKNNVNVYYLITPETIEEEIWNRLSFKQGVVDKVIEGKGVDVKELMQNL